MTTDRVGAGAGGPDPRGRVDLADLPAAGRVEETDAVIVCGAGPTGLVAALTLARAGVPVVVLEKGDGLSGESRASTFHPPTLELLDELGLAEPVVAAGLRAPTTQFRDRATGPVATFDLGVLADDTDFPFRVQLEQDKFTALAMEGPVRQGGLPMEVRFGWRSHAVLGQDDSGVRLLVGTADGFVEMWAPWMVAADGAHSSVRTSLGVDLVGETYPERFLVVSVADELRDLLGDLDLVNYVADPDEWLVLLRTPDHWRVLFPVRTDDPEAELAPDALRRRLDAIIPVPADGGSVERDWDVLDASLYVVSRRVAERMRVGRVLLAGDAAHQNSPLGGMGMNSGIQDAVSCGRRLATVLDGGPETLLDEYDANRRRVAVDYVQADAHANWLALREADPERRAALQADLRAVAADPVRHRERMQRTAMLDAVRGSL